MKIVYGLLIAVAAICGVGLFLPTEFAIAKSIQIDASPAEIHTLVGDLTKWDDWAPWKDEDPTMKTTLGDKTTGVGASQSWSGKDGDGELTFTKCDPATGIAYDMAFINEGARAPSTAAMTYSKEGDGTRVTWTMEGDVGEMVPPVIAGYMNAFVMKSAIGDMFDKGLATLKSKAEKK